jgi:glycosyltransferase involved in cell wall biosynthesis
MESTALTAVVTTRNRLGLLRSTLGSILDQRGVEIAVIVVDEGSRDGTQEFLEGLDDERVTVLRNDRPLGVSGARNAGIARATTDWVAICDDDDLWSPTKVRSQLQALASRADARWAVAGTVLVDGNLDIIGYRTMQSDGDTLAGLLTGNTVPATSGLLFDRRLFDEVGGFEDDLTESEDWDLVIRLARASAVAVADGPHVAYRIAGAGSSSMTHRMRRSFELLRDRYGELAAEKGVEFDAHGYELYLAQQALKADERITAARCYGRLAIWDRSPAHAVRAVGALVSPRTMDRVGDRRAAARVPREWLLEAERWLASVPVLEALPQAGEGAPR